jgi:hypothetical protein
VCLLLGTWSSEWISSADHGHILSFSLFLLTCQVALPLGLILVWSLCVCVQGQCDDQDEDQDLLEQELHDDQQCSLGHLIDL